MIEVIKYPEKAEWTQLTKRPAIENILLEKAVRKILDKVKAKGDKALKKFTKELDGVKLKKIQVAEKEIIAAEKLVPTDLKEAIQKAKYNIEKFHKAQKEDELEIEILPGITCRRKSIAIEKVGIYIPGGTAPLFSTVLMLAIPAQLADCNEINLCTPPLKEGNIHPAVLYAAKLCGLKNIFKIGGAQAIAAMAYGTETVPKVFKIFGPGNQFVTHAKQLVQNEHTAIDMPAGPSELLIIADDSAVPEFVAADLLSQAEHGPDSQVVLATNSESLIEKIQMTLSKQINDLPRKNIAEQALKNSKIVLLKNIEEAIGFSNFYAPEHLILSCENAEELSQKILAAGSVFIGNYSPESAGDYASGTNHTLPTNGYAAMYSGVSVDSFIKKVTFQRLSKEGLNQIANTVKLMAEAEGLQAHANAISIRLKN